MKPSLDRILQLPAMLRGERLLARLGAQRDLHAGSDRTDVLEFLDSFDRDLWFAGRALYRTGAELVVTAREDLLFSQPIAKCSDSGELPKFAEQLPNAAVREAVAGILKLRAMLPLVSIAARTQRAEVKNDDGKTVLRLRLLGISSPDDPQRPMLELCCVQPVRGYEAEVHPLLELLADLGLHPADSMAVARVVGELAAVPDVSRNRSPLPMSAGQTSREAVSSLLRELWSAARSREAGIAEDIDTEFLHEYRVALRRIRSLLALSRGVFPPETTADLKDAFKHLSNATNRLRDLDVYLLSQEPYRELLPGDLRPGLDEMFADFRTQREREQLDARQRLASVEYQRAAAHIERLLDAAGRSPASATAGMPAVELAARILGKRYRKTVSGAGTLGHASPDEAFHALRIECKKLRYALEFFGPLFEPEGVVPLTKRLKRLQDSLGAFNDLCVQQAAVAAYWDGKRRSGSPDALLTAAVGGLIAVLYQSRCLVRTQVVAQIGKFCSADAAAFVPVRPPAKRAA